jgi:hypothetical protein
MDRMSDISSRLTALRQRLDELKAERDAIEAQIDGCVDELASLAGDPAPAAAIPDGLPGARVLALLRRHPDRPMAPADVAQALGISRRAEMAAIRGLLARMAREGRVRRVAHGRYLAP